MALAGYAFGTAIQYLISRLEILLTASLALVIGLIAAYRWFWAWTERQAGKTPALEPVKTPTHLDRPTSFREPSSRQRG
jgi:hypothetical protein